MRLTIFGKSHAEGISKTSGKPYNFHELHYLGKAYRVEGKAAKKLIVDADQIAYDDIELGADYNVEFDDGGHCLEITPAEPLDDTIDL